MSVAEFYLSASPVRAVVAGRAWGQGLWIPTEYAQNIVGGSGGGEKGPSILRGVCDVPLEESQNNSRCPGAREYET